jgi:hypothetical protein
MSQLAPVDAGGTASWSSSALTDIVSKLRNGASDLNAVASSAPPAPDAGTSSDVVGEALAAVVRSAATASIRMETAADDVDTSKGTYRQTEADNTQKISNAGTSEPDQQNYQNTNYGSPSMIYPG